MIEERRAGAPHAAIIAAIVVSAVAVRMLIGDQGEDVTMSIQELLGPIFLLLLTLGLLLVIQFLSSERGSSVPGIFPSGHALAARGSPFGVLLFLVLVLLLLYSRISIFSGDDHYDCE